MSEKFFEKNISQKYPLDFDFPFLIFRIDNMLVSASNCKMWL